MFTTGFSRQIATGLAAFFLTALLVLANAPQERPESGLILKRSAVSSQILTVLTQHG